MDSHTFSRLLPTHTHTHHHHHHHHPPPTTRRSYVFGNVPAVHDNFSLVVLGIVAVSCLPVLFEVAAARARGAAAAGAGAGGGLGRSGRSGREGNGLRAGFSG